MPESNPSPDTAALLERLAILEKENALLREKIDAALVRRLFGAQSEKIEPGQLLLLLQGLDEPGKAPEPVAVEAPRRSTASHRLRVSEPRDCRNALAGGRGSGIDPAPVKAAPQDWRRGSARKSASAWTMNPRASCAAVRTDAAQVCATGSARCRAGDRAVAASAPRAQLYRRSGGFWRRSWWPNAATIFPLYRQESIYWTRHQVWLPRQTMAEWVGLAADWLKPTIYEHIRRDVLGNGYVQSG